MGKARKLISITVALVMLFSLAIPAMAVSVNVSNNVHTFKAQNFSEVNGNYVGEILVAWNGNGNNTANVSFTGNSGSVIITPYKVTNNQQTSGILGVSIEMTDKEQTVILTLERGNGHINTATVVVPAVKTEPKSFLVAYMDEEKVYLWWTSVSWNEIIPYPPEPTKSGYIFAGWKTRQGIEVTQGMTYAEIVGGDASVTLEYIQAQWEPAPLPEMEAIKIVKTMITGNQFDRLLKQRLFDEYDKTVENPPDSDTPYIPPVDTSRLEDGNNTFSNTNVWRSRGAHWNTPGETNAIVNFGSQCRLFEIWIFDGPAYAPVTFRHPGTNDKDFEVYGGSLQIYGNVSGNQATRDLLGTIEITNSNTWKKVNLINFNIAGEGFTTASLEFRKVQDTVNNVYSWSGGGWTSPAGEYVCDVSVPEIFIKGIPLGELTPDEKDEEDVWTPTPAGRPVVQHNFTLREFIGTNGFAFDYLPHYEPFGNIREYHNWSWTEFTANDGTGNNSAMTKKDGAISMFDNKWGVFDAYYQKLYDRGVEAIICIQGGIIGAPRSIPNFQADQSFENPQSYLAHAQSLFQHAARYGSNKNIDPNLVRVAPGTEKKTGLGLIKYYENWNEPNAYWETMGVHQFSGAMFAAMTSADYDGHMNSMGPDAGIKNADPNAKLVMGGLVGFPTEEKFSNMDGATLKFLYDMMKWFDENRSEEEWLKYNDSLDGYVRYPFDVMNGHYYSPDSGRDPDGKVANSGISPESDLVYDKIKSFVEFSHKYFPEAEVWLSEFGWETSEMMTSRYSATYEFTRNNKVYNPGINVGFDQYDVQANWLLRQYLLLAGAGIDRAQQYMLYNASFKDDDTRGGGMHQSDGFVNAGVNSQGLSSAWKKPSWYYANTFAYWLGDFRFNNEIKYGGRGLSANHADNLSVFEFKNGEGDLAYALWLNSSFGKAAKTSYTLDAGSAKYALLVEMGREELWGVTSSLNITDGKVTVEAGETPIFVIFSDDEQEVPVPPSKIDLTGKSITGTGNFNALINEQKAAGDVLNSIASTINLDPWNDNDYWGNGGFWAEIQLGGKYRLTNAAVWRVEGGDSGKIAFMARDAQGDWVKIAEGRPPSWVSGGWWDIFSLDYVTDAVRIVTTGDIKIREMLLYGVETDEDIGGATPFATAPRIMITPEMVSGVGEYNIIAQNQDKYGAPLQDAGNNMFNYGSFVLWQNNGYNAWFEINLGKEYDLTDLSIYFRGLHSGVTATSARMQFWDARTNQWKPVPKVKLDIPEIAWDGRWQNYRDINITTQKLRVEGGEDGGLNNIQIRGVALYGFEKRGDGFDNIVPGEPEPWVPSDENLVTIDFANNNAGYGLLGGSGAITDDPVHGKAYKVTASGASNDNNAEFRITGLNAMFEAGRDYILDWYYKVENSTTTRTTLRAMPGWQWNFYDGDAKFDNNQFWVGGSDKYGQYGGTSDTRNLSPRMGWWALMPFKADEWNRMILKFRPLEDGRWQYSLMVNDIASEIYTSNAISNLGMFEWVIFPSGGTSNVYFADIQIYEGTKVKEPGGDPEPPAKNLITVDFANNNAGYSWWGDNNGVTGTIIDDPAHGKAFKLLSNGSRAEFDLFGFGAVTPGNDYILEWYYKVEKSQTTRTKLVNISTWGALYDGDGKWGGSYDPSGGDKYGQVASGTQNLSPRLGWYAMIPFKADDWNHMVIKINVQQNGAWSYTLSVNGIESGKYNIDGPFTTLRWYIEDFQAGKAAYFANIQFYTEINP